MSTTANTDSHSNHQGRQLGQSLFWCVILLTAIGLVEILSSSAVMSELRFADSFLFYKKQTLIALAGFAVMFFSARLPMPLIEKHAPKIFWMSVLLMALIFVPQFKGNAGTVSRWLNIGGFRFQPSEIFKFGFIVMVSYIVSRPHFNPREWRSLAKIFCVFVIAVALLMKQPDFGTAVVFFLVTTVMVFLSGIPLKAIGILFGLGTVGAIGLLVAAPYRVKRIISFLDPFEQFRSGGYQVVQSYLGFANGGAMGMGLGHSRQKLMFLPEAHTDFILAIIAEELGFIGVFVVIGLFASIIYLGFRIAAIQKSVFTKFLASGMTSLIAIQALLNMGVCMGVLPPKGIPLPFLSNGSTCLLVFLIIIAVLKNLAESPTPSQIAKSTQP